MNVVKLIETEALNQGSELWIIHNDPSLKWWSKLDFLSGFLLSQNFLRKEKELPQELISIIEATSLDIPSHQKLHNYVLLGTGDHFLNKWTLVWNSLSEEQLADIIIGMTKKLNFKNVRLSSHPDSITKALKTRQTTSLETITYIENT